MSTTLKVTDERVVHSSRNNHGQLLGATESFKSQISVFSYQAMRIAEAFRALEVVLDTGYTYSADM